MASKRGRLAWLVPVALSVGCGGGGTTRYDLTVGGDDAGGAFGSGGDDASSETLRAHIEEDHVTVTFVTLTCSGPCADVVAVASGGDPPYAFAWDDGSTSSSRHVCPTSSTNYHVDVNDRAVGGEVPLPAQTVRVPLTADVVACPDGGSADAGSDVYWATWTAMQAGAPGTARGNFSPPTGPIQVTYGGEVNAASTVTGTASTGPLGAVTFAPASTFISPTVGNGPPPTGMIVLNGSAMLTQTLTFSAPVKDPLLAVSSLGANVSKMVLDFDATPEVLSNGPEMVGPLSIPGTLTVSGQTLTGVEGTGVVQLSGTFTSIHFTVPTPESNTYGYFTVGIRGPG